MDCSPPGSSVCGILQAKILEWVAIPLSRGSERKSRSQMPFLTVHTPAFDVTGCVKDCLSELPSITYRQPAPYLPLGDPQLPPPWGNPLLEYKSSLEEESRTRASLCKQALGDERVQGISIYTTATVFPRERIPQWCPVGEQSPWRSMASSQPPITETNPPQPFQVSSSLLSCYELLFKKHI